MLLWLTSIDTIDIVKGLLEYVKGYYQEILQSTKKASMSESMKHTVKIVVFPPEFLDPVVGPSFKRHLLPSSFIGLFFIGLLVNKSKCIFKEKCMASEISIPAFRYVFNLK